MPSKDLGNSGESDIFIQEYKQEHNNHYFEDKKGPNYVATGDMIQQICTTCQTISKAKLGHTTDRDGTHLIQTKGMWKSISFVNPVRLQIHSIQRNIKSNISMSQLG